jgi:hypothetical protein
MPPSLQKQLLERIIASLPRKSDAVDKLSDLLHLGKDAIYRRIRGDTLLAPDEMSLLAREFNISLDALVFQQTDSVFFSFNGLATPISHVDEYLTGVRDTLLSLGRVKGAEVFLSSPEIPVFHLCYFPELIGFKLFVWARTVWNLEQFQNCHYDPDLVSPETSGICREILNAYHRLPTTELRSVNFFDSTLDQIESCAAAGAFADEKAPLLLCDRLEELAAHLCVMARHGRKFNINTFAPDSGSRFELYHSEVNLSSDAIFLSSPDASVVYSSFGNPHYLKSADPRICTFTGDWFRKAVAASTPLGKQADQAREFFFNKIRRRIDFAREAIVGG